MNEKYAGTVDKVSFPFTLLKRTMEMEITSDFLIAHVIYLLYL